jgi:hypothetical protein
MNGLDTFLEKYPEVIDSRPVPADVISRYEKVLPPAWITLWKKHGFGGYHQGLFWTINPDEFKPYLERMLEMEWSDTTPVMRTAFGDIVVIYNLVPDDPGYSLAGFETVDVRHQKTEYIGSGVENLFSNILTDPGRLMSRLNIDVIPFYNVKRSLGHLNADQCYGYSPVLAQQGKEKEKNVRIFPLHEHLQELTGSWREKLKL